MKMMIIETPTIAATYLESRQTLFKWKIGMTRVAFSNPATATASHICVERMEKLPNKF